MLSAHRPCGHFSFPLGLVHWLTQKSGTRHYGGHHIKQVSYSNPQPILPTMRYRGAHGKFFLISAS